MDKPEAVTEPSFVWCSRAVGRRGGDMDILLISVGHSYLGFVRPGVKQYSSISLSFVVRP